MFLILLGTRDERGGLGEQEPRSSRLTCGGGDGGGFWSLLSFFADGF